MKITARSSDGKAILIPVYFRTDGAQSMGLNDHDNHFDLIHYNLNNESKVVRFFNTDEVLKNVITNSAFLNFPKVFKGAFIDIGKFKDILGFRKIIYFLNKH